VIRATEPRRRQRRRLSPLDDWATMRGMRPRPGYLTALAVFLSIALTGAAVAQEEPADDTPSDEGAADEPQADEGTPAGEEPAADKPTLSPAAAAAGASAATPVGEPKSDKSSAPLSLATLTRRLEGVKMRSDQIRARVDMLKDAVLQGGKGAQAVLIHRNKMGDQFRLTRLVYVMDGTQIFSQRDDAGSLHDKKSIDILSGPIAPGNHTISVTMTYKGHGYGPFKYLNKQTFTVKGNQTFRAVPGKSISVDVLAFERNNVPLEQRPAVSFKVSRAK